MRPRLYSIHSQVLTMKTGSSFVIGVSRPGGCTRLTALALVPSHYLRNHNKQEYNMEGGQNKPMNYLSIGISYLALSDAVTDLSPIRWGSQWIARIIYLRGNILSTPVRCKIGWRADTLSLVWSGYWNGPRRVSDAPFNKSIIGTSILPSIVALLIGKLGLTVSKAIEMYMQLEPSLSVKPAIDDEERRRNTEAFRSAFQQFCPRLNWQMMPQC